MPNAVERMTTVMQQEAEPVIVYGPYLRIDQRGSVIGKDKRRLYSGFVTKCLFQDVFIHSCGSMFPKNTLKEAGGFDTSLRVCSDYDLWLRLSLKYRFVALSEPTFKKRRHSGNLSNLSTQNRITELEVLERFYYERGGDKVVPKRIALSKEAYRAGKCALADEPQKAKELLIKSLRLYPTLKTILYLVWAI